MLDLFDIFIYFSTDDIEGAADSLFVLGFHDSILAWDFGNSTGHVPVDNYILLYKMRMTNIKNRITIKE
jgi:hypothetical protein